jgi:hypothetical protein
MRRNKIRVKREILYNRDIILMKYNSNLMDSLEGAGGAER